jgi:hypothetical protein
MPNFRTAHCFTCVFPLEQETPTHESNAWQYPLRQIQDECTPDLLFEVVILTLERSEGEGSLYFVFVLSHMRQGTPTLILL